MFDAPVYFCHTLAMQVWTKLTLGFAATALVIVGLYGGYQLREEEADLRASAERDLRLIGTTVQVAAGNALRDRQAADVREIVDAVKLHDPSTDVTVFDASGVMIAGSWGAGETEALVRRAVTETQSVNRAVVHFEGPRGLSHLVAALPIVDDDRGRMGTLGLVRSLDEEQRDLLSETRAMVLSLATLVIGLTASGWFLASVYVRGPLRNLVQTMRAVRAGDLSAKASFHRADEMGAAVTEFNAMMSDLIEARRRLITEVERREALETSLQRTDKLVTVGQLSAGLAHEIGSPLQVVNGRARALAARTDVPSDVRRTAEILASESDRIARIVEQLLTFSRHTVPSITEAQLSAPVRDIVELFEPEARRQGVHLEFQDGECLPAAHADVAQVQQVVMNLLINAVRSTPPGGTVRIALGGASFVVASGQMRPSVSLIVEDTGVGIPDDLLPHIFEPFFTTRSHAGGTGLGLAVVKSIVDAHGGSITVNTRIGQGTRFTVQFPVADAAVAGGWVA
jgi:signal transduction histidine kinase